MKKICWQLNQIGEDDILILKHSNFSGKIILSHNGKIILKQRAILGDTVNLSFSVKGEKYNLDIVPTALEYEYTLTCNKEKFMYLRDTARLKLEWWAWICAGLCFIIPVLFIETFILYIIGIYGGVRCLKIATNPNEERKNRIINCVKTTIMTWMFLGIFILIVNGATDYFIKMFM